MVMITTAAAAAGAAATRGGCRQVWLVGGGNDAMYRL